MDLQEFAGLVDDQLSQHVSLILRTVPYAEHLTVDERILDDAYYIRHRIETVKRIRMTSKTDALALAALIDIDYEAARQWSHYISQEMNHDLLFIRDLAKHGCTQDFIETLEPLHATTQMIDYLIQRIQSEGPIAAVAYSVFVEWNSERASARAVARAEQKYSSIHVSGAKAHLKIDEDQGHYETILRLAYFLSRDDQLDVLFRILQDIAGFFNEYFWQLYQATIEGQTTLRPETQTTSPSA